MYLDILLPPVILGLVLRSVVGRSPKGPWLTLGCAALTAFLWVWVVLVPSYGSELNGVLAMQSLFLTGGALAAGAYFRLRR